MWLPLTQPFDLATTLESGQVFRWNRIGDGWYGVVSNQLLILHQLNDQLQFETSGGSTGSNQIVLHEYFRLGDDLFAVYDRLNLDQRLSEAIQFYPGLRLIRQDPWECLISFICSTNANIPRIRGMLKNLSETFGEQVNLGAVMGYTFPSAIELARVERSDFERLGLGYRAKYVSETAKLISSGVVDLDVVRTQPYSVAKSSLMNLPGVGPKVADCVLLFSLEKLEAFPVDVWVRRAVEEWYLGGEKYSLVQIQDWAQKQFGSSAGYAQQYLFHRRRLSMASGT